MPVIREMRVEDLEQVAALEKEIFSEPWSQAGFLSSLSSSDTLYLVAEEEGEIQGYCGLLQSFEEADITNVAVKESCRRQGVARSLLKELMSLGGGRGICRFTLEVRVSNAGALRLYEKLGFETVGIRKGFYSSPREDAAIMWTRDFH